MPQQKSPKPDAGPEPRPAVARRASGAGRLALASTAVVVAALVAAVAWYTSSKEQQAAGGEPAGKLTAEFVGSDRCVDCHAEATAAWRGSQHARAMQHATGQTVLGDFDDAAFDYAGITSRFFRRDGKFVVRTDGPDGQMGDYEVQYTFGLEPLQQYLVGLPGGRLQALSIAWDTRPREDGGQRWFHLYPDERIDHRDELHWTRRSQNWNFMCADCHSTNVRKGYDAASDSYDTRWSEVSVGCESCHGPGSAHLDWAREQDADNPRMGLTVALDERAGVTWPIDPATGNARRSAPRRTQREIEACAPCHARRSQIAEGYQAGARFLDHYLPELLTPGLYHVDGQQRDEVFVWGSWLQSRMHAAGVTCSDCHEPHSQQLRLPGNAVCAQCHAPGKYDDPGHHHHPAGSAGSQCVDCHMPATTYMVVDPRRDHSMRVPRPDRTVTLGVPNACDDCHRERGAAWAAAAVEGWRGQPGGGFQTFAQAFHDAEGGKAGAAADLAAIAGDPTQPTIVRASALARLEPVAGRDMELLARAANDADPLVRLGALRAAQFLPPNAAAAVAGGLLADPVLAVRIEAARVTAGQQGSLPAAQQAAWQAAADDYVATQRLNLDRPEANTGLGTFEAALGRNAEAMAAFGRATGLDPQYVPAYLNAADMLRAQGRDPEALLELERGLAQAPENAALHFARGLARVRLGDAQAAIGDLRQAVRLAHDERRYSYVLAIALNSAGDADAAIAVLDRVLQRWPENRELLVARTAILRDTGRLEAAAAAAEHLLALYPADPEARGLAAQLVPR